MWTCPKCKRAFARKNQRHACGIGDVAGVVRDRPQSLVSLYASLVAFAKKLGPIEVVARERYVLFRSRRIFADIVVMSDALRVAVHLARRVELPIFFKVGMDRKRVTHVAEMRSRADFARLKPYLREAYEFSLSESPKSALQSPDPTALTVTPAASASAKATADRDAPVTPACGRGSI